MLDGKSMLHIETDTWKRKLALLTEYFHYDQLKGFTEEIERTIEGILAELSAKISDITLIK